jgi:hypothetical protein
MFYSCKKSESNLYLEYASPSLIYVLSNDTLKIINIQTEYDNPVSAVPSNTKFVESFKVLSEKEMEILKEEVLKSGIFELQKYQFGASEGERYYPYTLKVEMGNKSTSILYRSNPQFESSPKEMDIIIKKVDELSK